jgi:hypothetical protein
VNNGAYNPLERLAKIRSDFFARPGKTLGQQSVAVKSQDGLGLPENVRYTRNDISFAAVNIPGSNSSMLPWTGLGYTSPTPEQVQEVNSRTAADIELIHDTFAQAKADRNRSVVLQTQADMFDPTVASPQFSDYSAFKPIVQAIIDEASAFDGPVYLFNGDSHVYPRQLAVQCQHRGEGGARDAVQASRERCLSAQRRLPQLLLHRDR